MKLDLKLPDNIFVVIATTVGGLVLYQLIFYALKKWTQKKKLVLPSLLQVHIYTPGFVLFLLVTFLIDLTYLDHYINKKFWRFLNHALLVAILATSGWLLIRIISVLRGMTLHRFRSRSDLDFSVRSANTKFSVIQRVLNFIIVLATFAVILMTFEQVRLLGRSLLASAGLVGLVLGFAAQKSLGSLFAGIQIAISQPIRLDDTVVVEGRFGTIGEITLSYVIVNVWDGSRLVVPINYFLEKPFENWTRMSSEVIGKVKIYADYTLPVEDLRTVFKEWVSASPLWDKRGMDLIVSGASEKTIEIRATFSAKNSGDSFQLECLVREKMISWIRDNHPESLPKARFSGDPTI